MGPGLGKKGLPLTPADGIRVAGPGPRKPLFTQPCPGWRLPGRRLLQWSVRSWQVPVSSSVGDILLGHGKR